MFTTNNDGFPGTTVTFTASADSAYTLAQMGATLTGAGGARAYMVLISVETSSARISFTAAATASLGHLRYADDTFQISGERNLALLTMANDTAGSNFTAQITPFFSTLPADI